MNTPSIQFTDTLVAVSCGECGITFGMVQSYYDKRLEDHKNWYCPNGHTRHFIGKSESEKLQDKIDTLEQRINWRDTTIAEKNRQIEQLSYSVRAQKAAKTKIMKRIKNGICPCCNRTFSNLQNHFKTKHPELLEA